MAKARMHQLLAVEGDLEGIFKKILAETEHVFKEAHQFDGQVRTLSMFDKERESEEIESDRKEIVTTVNQRLSYTEDHVVRYLDAVLQKDLTNQTATADIKIGETGIAENVPATTLLGLESRLKVLRKIYDAIPTLKDSISWIPDPNRGEDIFTTENPEIRMKDEQEIKVHVIYPHKFPKEGEHGESLPAQVEKIPEKKTVGSYELFQWSGRISSARKAELIGKLDELIREVKKARQRANMTEVVRGNIGKSLFDFINS